MSHIKLLGIAVVLGGGFVLAGCAPWGSSVPGKATPGSGFVSPATDPPSTSTTASRRSLATSGWSSTDADGVFQLCMSGATADGNSGNSESCTCYVASIEHQVSSYKDFLALNYSGKIVVSGAAEQSCGLDNTPPPPPTTEAPTTTTTEPPTTTTTMFPSAAHAECSKLGGTPVIQIGNDHPFCQNLPYVMIDGTTMVYPYVPIVSSQISLPNDLSLASEQQCKTGHYVGGITSSPGRWIPRSQWNALAFCSGAS